MQALDADSCLPDGKAGLILKVTFQCHTRLQSSRSKGAHAIGRADLAETDANNPLQQAILELEAFARGGLPLSHYVKNVPPVQLAEKSWRVGYPDYQVGMDRLWTALNDAGLSTVTSPAYNSWLAQNKEPLTTPQEIDELGREELLLRLFSIRRAERFCDGYWTAVLERGLFLAYALRLSKLPEA